MKRYLLLCLGLLLSPVALAADSSGLDCALVERVCVEEGGTKLIQPSNCPTCPAQAINRDCWKYAERHRCTYAGNLPACTSQNLTGCTVKTSTCGAEKDGACVGWDVEYQCEDTGCRPTQPLPTGATLGDCSSEVSTCLQVSTEDPNFCVRPGVVKTCYVIDPNSDDACTVSSSCVTSSTQCLEADSRSGLCTFARQTFRCGAETKTCTAYETYNTCTGSMTKGLEVYTDTEPKSFDDAVAAMGLANEIAKSQTSGSLYVFSGEAEWCTKGDGIAALLTNDCCKQSLSKRGGKPFGECTDEHIELAAARRAARTVYLGQWCSKDRFLIGCIQKKQGYCVFPSLMARIINEQGRDQLNALVSTGATNSTTAATHNFNYYTTATVPTWERIPTGTSIPVFALRWPNYCRSESTYLQALSAGTANGSSCPTSLSVVLASCEGDACAGQSVPPANYLADDGGWSLANADPMSNAPVAVGRYAVVSGVCNPSTEMCAYKPTTWEQPGGQIWVRTTVQFPLYTGVPASENIVLPAYQLGAFTLTPRSYSGSGGTSMPSYVPLDYHDVDSTITGTANLPTKVMPESPFSIGATGVQAYGSCDPDIKICSYVFMKTVLPEALSWGTAQAPNCRGFTSEQLSLLDFNKMDFTEWLNSIMPTLPMEGPDAAQLAADAAADQEVFFNTYASTGYQEAEVTGPSPIRIAPTELKQTGNRTATLTVTRNWPQTYETASANDDPVTRVLVDWGHGGNRESLVLSGGAYSASHVFPDATSTNVRYTVKVEMYTTKSGVKTASTYVTMVYETPTETTSIGASPSGGSTEYRIGVDPVTGASMEGVRGVP